MAKAYIGIGSNLGDKQKNISRAVKLLNKKCKILNKSSLYETEPIGFKNQYWFLNCAVGVQTELSPQKLLSFLKSIENSMGRINFMKNGPRIIDLDIIFYGNKIINTSNLIIPHPRLHERLFVLRPLKEIYPELVHPIYKKSVKELMEYVKNKEVVKLHQRA